MTKTVVTITRDTDVQDFVSLCTLTEREYVVLTERVQSYLDQCRARRDKQAAKLRERLAELGE